VSGQVESTIVFATGILFIGVGGGLFGHGTLTATMNFAPPGQSGLALGAWGAVQATAAGFAIAAGGIIRDVVDSVYWAPLGYEAVYFIEIVMLFLTVVAMAPLIRKSPPLVQV